MKNPNISINGLRIWAIYCVVFHHTLQNFAVTSLLESTHWSFTIHGLYIFLFLSGAALSLTCMPKTFSEYLKYLNKNTLILARIYLFFFVLQFLFCCIKSYIFDGVLLPFSLSHIFTQFLLPSKSPALTIWYMHLLVVTTAILPLLIRLFSTIGFWICFVLPYILSFFLPMNYSLERLCHTIPVVLLGYRFGPPLESTDKKLIMLFGIIWLSSIGFFIAYETGILGDSYFSTNNETPILERLTYQNIITFTFVHLNHIFGFYFWMNVVGVIFGKFYKLQRQFTHYAFSSIDIYLIHKPYLTFLFRFVFYRAPHVYTKFKSISFGFYCKCTFCLFDLFLLCKNWHSNEKIKMVGIHCFWETNPVFKK